MTNTLLPQSEVADPYAPYARMPAEEPVHRDAHNNPWAVYSHAGCRHVLEASTAAHIPAPNAVHGLSEIANKAIGNLARLANPPAHAAFTQAVMHLFDAMRSGATAALLTRLRDE